MNDFQIPILSRGAHEEGSGYGCLMEQLSWIQGDVWTDAPACVHPYLASMLRSLNDGAPTPEGPAVLMGPATPIAPEASARLVKLAAKAVGTVEADVDLDTASDAMWLPWGERIVVVEEMIDDARAQLGLDAPSVTVEDFVRATEAISA